LDKPHILALAAETSFLLFKEQVPFKLKKNISGSMRKEDLSIDITFNPCKFSLDSPFKVIFLFYFYFPCLEAIIRSQKNIIFHFKDDIEASFYVAAMMEMLFFLIR
jgi:hypothetical protein